MIKPSDAMPYQLNYEATQKLLLFQALGPLFNSFIAFVKERFHNAVEIDILGIF